MKVLKCVIETLIKVDYSDLEEFIRAHTGHTYEIVPNEEWGNDEQHRFIIDGSIGERELKEWNDFKNSGKARQYRILTFMNCLCAENKLAPGVYLINVSW